VPAPPVGNSPNGVSAPVVEERAYSMMPFAVASFERM
jgi:hypothetical protein